MAGDKKVQRGLVKDSKTIPMHGGIQQDADDFLFDEPHMANVKNGVFNKQGVISKRNMWTSEAAATPSFPDKGLCFGESTSDDTSVLLDDRGVRVYRRDTDEWTVFDEYDQYKPTVLGIGDQTYGCVNVGGGDFEDGSTLLVYEQFTVEENSHDVFIEIRDDEGIKVFNEKISGGLSPRVDRFLWAANTVYALVWCDSSGAMYTRTINSSGWLSAQWTIANGLGPSTSVDLDGYVFGAQDTSQVWEDSGSYYRGHCRLGLTENSSDGHVAQYAMCGAVLYVIAAWRDANGQLRVSRVVPGTGVVTEITIPGSVDTASDRFGVLDCSYNNNGDVAVLTAKREHAASAFATGIGTTDIEIEEIDINAMTHTATYTVALNTTGITYAGSVTCNSDFSLRHVMITRLPNHEMYQMGLRDSPTFTLKPITQTYENTTPLGASTTLSNTRIVSRLRMDDDGDFLYVVLEDDTNNHPEGTSAISAGVQRQGSSPSAIKGRTSNLLKIDVSNGNWEVIATLGAGTSKAICPSRNMTNVHLNCLYLSANDAEWEDEIAYTGRQQIVPEDLYLFVEDNRPVNAALTGANEMVKSLGLGVGRAITWRLNRVDENTYIPRARRGNSVVVGTARPSIITPAGMAPASVPGTPEIHHVKTGDTANPFSVTYTPIKGATNQAQMYAICGYTDQNGNVYRSSPSSTVYCDGIDSDDLLTDKRPVDVSLMLPFMDQNRTCFIELYVGMKLTEPLLVGTYQGTPGQFATISFNPFIETPLTKENIVGTRAAYTSGGQLGVDPLPCFSDATMTSNRMWFLPIDFPGTVAYSKLFEENLPVEFNGALTIPFGHDRKITALGTLDDKVVIFESNKIHVVNGVGVGNSGEGSDFVVQELSSDVGANGPGGVVETPDGLMFFSGEAEEIYLLTRNLELVDIGKPVSDLTKGGVPIDSCLVPKNHEVRFLWSGTGTPDLREAQDTTNGVADAPPRPRTGRTLDDSDPCLIYNYRLKRWSWHTQTDGRSCWTIGGDFAWSTGIAIRWEAEDEYYYGGVSMTLETPWLKIGDLQGFGRLYQIDLLGRYLSRFKEDPASPGFYDAGDIYVTLKYDYEENGTQHTYTWRANKDMNTDDRDNLQVKIRPGRQKIQAVKLIIEEIETIPIELHEPNYTLGKGFEISGLNLIFGLKGPEYKSQPTSRSK